MMGHLPAKFGGEEIGTAHFEKSVVPALVSVISGKKWAIMLHHVSEESTLFLFNPYIERFWLKLDLI